jgi:hypothetical protein
MILRLEFAIRCVSHKDRCQVYYKNYLGWAWGSHHIPISRFKFFTLSWSFE